MGEQWSLPHKVQCGRGHVCHDLDRIHTQTCTVSFCVVKVCTYVPPSSFCSSPGTSQRHHWTTPHCTLSPVSATPTADVDLPTSSVALPLSTTQSTTTGRCAKHVYSTELHQTMQFFWVWLAVLPNTALCQTSFTNVPNFKQISVHVVYSS